MNDPVSSSPPGAGYRLLDSGAPPGKEEIREESAVTLSGGGYRAMLFHLGFLWRMRDAGLLQSISRFSSVSGGAITAGALAVAWNRIDWSDDGQSFRKLVADPLIELSRHTIDVPGGIIGLIPGLSGSWVRRAYDKYLYQGTRLADLPQSPDFIFNSTSLQTGKLVRFSGKWLAEWTTGQWDLRDIPLATAVAASSAFPPVLAPVVVDLAGHVLKSTKGAFRQPTAKLFLVDGGVYDNLGIEAVWKKYRTVYVSDAGAAFRFDPDGTRFLPSLAVRTTELMMDQIASLRFRQMWNGYQAAPGTALHRGGFLVSSDFFVSPRPAGGLPYSQDRALRLAGLATRLKAYPPEDAFGLVNWGYLATDDHLRKQGPPDGRCELPYPDYPI